MAGWIPPQLSERWYPFPLFSHTDFTQLSAESNCRLEPPSRLESPAFLQEGTPAKTQETPAKIKEPPAKSQTSKPPAESGLAAIAAKIGGKVVAVAAAAASK